MNFIVSVEWKTCMRYIQRIISDIYILLLFGRLHPTNTYFVIGWQSIFLILLSYCIGYIYMECVIGLMFIYIMWLCEILKWLSVITSTLHVTIFDVAPSGEWCYCWWTLCYVIIIVTLTFSMPRKMRKWQYTPGKRCPAGHND